MQLAFDAADRLVELLEERGAPVPAEEAARTVLRLVAAPEALARTLVDDLIAGDARLRWHGRRVGLAAAAPSPPLEEASYVVFDLETTGLAATSARICEIGAVRVEALEVTDEFTTLVNPGTALPAPIALLTGLRDADLRAAPSAAHAVRAFTAFAGRATLVAHNARFDSSFLDRELERLTGRRLAAPVLDTVALARRLLAGRTRRASLARLSEFFGTSTRPCHRALPDARATAEILVALIGLAQERGARTVDDLFELCAPRKRRVYTKRSLVHGAPSRPGVYLFRGRDDLVLYVGRARDLRARLRSYFRSERQRPAVEAALAAVDRVEWHVLGSELEAGLEELRLIRDLRPPANARSARPDRHVFLHRRGERVVVSRDPGPLGPIPTRRQAELAARALEGAAEEELEQLPHGPGPLPRLRARLGDLADCLRYEDAARLRDRIAALERVLARLRALDRLRAADLCLVAPATEPGWRRAFFVAGRVCSVRNLPPGDGARLELEAGWAAVRAARASGPVYDAEAADELLLVHAFLRRPPPELEVIQPSIRRWTTAVQASST